MDNKQKVRPKFGYEVFFESCIVGCDDKGVIYIRTTGLVDGAVQLVRIKPSEFEKVALHLVSRKDKPQQGVTPKHRKEFVPLSERINRPDWIDEDEDEITDPVVLVSPGTQFRERRRAMAPSPPVIIPPKPPAPPPSPSGGNPVFRERRRATVVEVLPQPAETPPQVFRVRRRVLTDA